MVSEKIFSRVFLKDVTRLFISMEVFSQKFLQDNFYSDPDPTNQIFQTGVDWAPGGPLTFPQVIPSKGPPGFSTSIIPGIHPGKSLLVFFREFIRSFSRTPSSDAFKNILLFWQYFQRDIPGFIQELLHQGPGITHEIPTGIFQAVSRDIPSEIPSEKSIQGFLQSASRMSSAIPTGVILTQLLLESLRIFLHIATDVILHYCKQFVNRTSSRIS